MVAETRVLRQVEDRTAWDRLRQPTDLDLVTRAIAGWLATAPGRR